jgi:hypothetical protein
MASSLRKYPRRRHPEPEARHAPQARQDSRAEGAPTGCAIHAILTALR